MFKLPLIFQTSKPTPFRAKALKMSLSLALVFMLSDAAFAQDLSAGAAAIDEAATGIETFFVIHRMSTVKKYD